MGSFLLSQFIAIRCFIFIGCCAVGISPGCTERHLTASAARVAETLGMKPFGPTGGYPPGTVVAIEENGLPIEVLSANWLREQGKEKTVTEPKNIGRIQYDVKGNFLAELNARNAGIDAVGLSTTLTDMNSFSLLITSAKTSKITNGPMPFIAWFNRLDPVKPDDLCILRDVATAAQGRRLFYVHEVLEITRGEYQTKWNRDLDASAKATFESLMALSGNLTWATDGMARIEITEDTPVFAAYKATEIHHNSLAIQRALTSADIRSTLAIEARPCGRRQP